MPYGSVLVCMECFASNVTLRCFKTMSRIEYSTSGKFLNLAGVEERVEAPSFPFPAHHVRWEDSCNNLNYVDCVFMVTKNNVDTMTGAGMCLAPASLKTFDVSTLLMAHDPPFSGTKGTYVDVIVCPQATAVEPCACRWKLTLRVAFRCPSRHYLVK